MLLACICMSGQPTWATNPTDHATQNKATKLNLEQIKNAVYRLPPEIGDEPDAMLKLTDGKYQDKDMTVQFETAAFGDLNGDGWQDAAVVFYWNGGGTGCFQRLEVFLNKDGNPVPVATAVLGDRVGIRGIKIKSGVIILDALSHGPNDPAGLPTVKRRARYKLKGENLIGPESLY